MARQSAKEVFSNRPGLIDAMDSLAIAVAARYARRDVGVNYGETTRRRGLTVYPEIGADDTETQLNQEALYVGVHYLLDQASDEGRRIQGRSIDTMNFNIDDQTPDLLEALNRHLPSMTPLRLRYRVVDPTQTS